MTDDSEKVAILEERSKNQKERIEKLESNQRTGVISILGLVGKAIFDYLQGGA